VRGFGCLCSLWIRGSIRCQANRDEYVLDIAGDRDPRCHRLVGGSLPCCRLQASGEATRRDTSLYLSSHLPRVPTMDTRPQQPIDAKPQRPKDRDGAISALNVAIDALHLAEKSSKITPIKTVLLRSTFFSTIRVRLLLFYNDLLQVHT
jgi:hypothetical protein